MNFDIRFRQLEHTFIEVIFCFTILATYLRTKNYLELMMEFLDLTAYLYSYSAVFTTFPCP